MAEKFLTQVAGVLTENEGLTTSAGAGDAGKIPALDGSGKIDTSMMPTGIGADTKSIEASENIAAGDYVNIHDSSGAKIRKADASAVATQAHGFVLAAVTSGANGTVYFEGANTGVSGLTPGIVQYLSETAGVPTATAPTTSGAIVQRLGVATAAADLNTEIESPIVLA